MFYRDLFKKPRNSLEGVNNQRLSYKNTPAVPDEMCVACPGCKRMLFSGDLQDNTHVCHACGYHFRINARQRIGHIADTDSFVESEAQMRSGNILDFPEYGRKLKNAALESAENEAVITGTCTINGKKCALFVMEPYFMMGSMGTVVGEKITALFELAVNEKLPVVGFTVSGGARMQEGILSLMQMAKTSGAVRRHSDAGGLYISVLTDPTTGGVTASFAMEADIILAEPGALICFAGPRVIEQTIRQKLPSGFQRAEFLLEKGFVDEIVARGSQKKIISRLLGFHEKEASS